jgi:valyl-tRNA synthetase
MELSKYFMPGPVEEKWYSHWLSKGYFNSYPDHREAYTIVIPPPNVTGVLHMGHTLNETVQDILIRRARMSGFNACWIPGSDHASIATEARVVQMLKEKGIEKKQLSREAFLQYAYEWREKYGGIIYSQIAKLGCSVDWNRVAFTMDPDYYQAVIHVFIDLFRKQLIYRGARMVHWDPVAKTALSDEEVEYKEIVGKLYYIRYQVVSDDLTEVSGDQTGKSYLVIATQRPETIMGDVAVCVHPDDKRWRHLKGKFAIVPLVNRKVPIIFDSYVDPAFGTGVLKITPAHDINDYNIGLKHKLPIIDTLNDDGTLSERAEVFVGLDRFEARRQAVAQLKAQGFLEKEEEYQTRLGYSQRTQAVVEPRISTQWFVRMQALAGPALKEVMEGRVKIHPGEKFMATYKYWLENLEDWCISRQLWWGQRIPAWYAPDGSFVVAASIDDALQQFKEQGAERLNADDLSQDQDVLDTWFSSWLWPIEVFKGITHPGNKDIQYYYPSAVLVTGQDIIFFWVARMIMAGMAYMKERPFNDVYFTGMVRDKQGRKMSKSLGNSPDLLNLIEKYGADAVRFGILISAPAGNDLLFDEGALEQGRNFNNKLWNALKLVESWKLKTQEKGNSDINADFALIWFENRLRQAKTEITRQFKEFRLSEALKTIYSLIWDDFCSWYLEWVKPDYGQSIETAILSNTIVYFDELLQLLHPFMPFVTEEIYHLLKDRNDDLCIRQFAEPEEFDAVVESRGRLLIEAISSIREARTKNQVKAKDKIGLHIQTVDVEVYTPILPLLAKQVNAKPILFVKDAVANSIAVLVQKDPFYIEINKPFDANAQKEEILKELAHLKGFLDLVDRKLVNERFVQNAKPEVLALEQKKKRDTLMKIQVLEESLLHTQ